MVLLGWLLGLLCLSGLSLMDGSPGDNSYGFRTCVAQCRENFDCPVAAHDYKWTTNHCFRCRYACMWRSVDDFGSSPPQFFGKWPFIAWWIEFFGRFYVVQEPASAIFSVMNLAAVYIMFRRVKQGVSKRNRMRKVWLGYGIVGMAAWVASTFFHSVDFWFSEMLDYFAACALIVYALFASITFVLKLFQRSFAGRILWLILGISMLLFYLNHITYLWTLSFILGVFRLRVQHEVLRSLLRPNSTDLHRLDGQRVHQRSLATIYENPFEGDPLEHWSTRFRIVGFRASFLDLRRAFALSSGHRSRSHVAGGIRDPRRSI
ncbi:hypothetical protein L596_013010 [Steinernema carpocapsae]|uniref:Post-GPI attachment to proteins factor 3 n=1 Tax=Steinernema carpocapsae TaxID=34508 RepID=A0A4U5NYY4_STECR|nr:hypothetical protein L596_013010 [Steinernema carpocapsae]